MNVEIFGNSPAAAFLAALMASNKLPVVWFTTGLKDSLRPVLLRSTVVGNLRRFLMRHGASAQFLLDAPELEAWGVPGGHIHRFQFDFNQDDADRWVCERDLTRALGELARSMGTTLRHVPVFPPSAHDLPLGGLRFVDVDAAEAPHWAVNRESGAPEVKWHLTEIRFSQAGADVGPAVQQFMLFEGALGCLDPHPGSGYTLTLMSKSRYAIEKALGTIAHPVSEGPRKWRVLHLMNPGAQRRDRVITSGLSRLILKEAFPFGASLGTYSPCLNWHASESLAQAERLFRFVMGSEASLGAWTVDEQKRFRAVERRMGLWERALVSSRFQGEFLAAAGLLPKSLRHFLKTPL